jgi:hypothetical protein
MYAGHRARRWPGRLAVTLVWTVTAIGGAVLYVWWSVRFVERLP